MVYIITIYTECCIVIEFCCYFSVMSFFCLYVQQTEVIAAAAAGVAAEGLSPEEAKIQAKNAAHLSVALAENAIVILMLVEDHLRSQAQHFCTSLTAGKDPMAAGVSRRASLSSDAGGLPLDVCNTWRLNVIAFYQL
uniref:Uncharacterized protein n=1 Tax=Zea mays TaxID=4577 RepID=A0A804Q4V0_MAIZE